MRFAHAPNPFLHLDPARAREPELSGIAAIDVRAHGDLRELNYLYDGGEWDVRVGFA